MGMEIHWVHAGELRDDQRSLVEARLRSLENDRNDLIDVRITVRRNGHHRHGGQEVRITCQARGHELVAARTRPDAGLALDEAVDAFEREVWRMRDRGAQRRAEAGQAPPELGVVDEIVAGQGYGFIVTDAGERLYFHRNALHGGLDFERLEEGDRVSLNFEAGEKGLQATVVRPAPPDAP
jgi:cold shock CspA family protein